MKYNKEKKIIFIHIPKCAGTSVRKIFKSWFKDDFSYFYRYGGVYKLRGAELSKSLIVFGHFNSNHGNSVDKIMPEPVQYISIFREPLDTHISAYFYYKKRFGGMIINPFYDHINWILKGKFSKATFEILKRQRNWINKYKNLDDWIKNEPLSYLNHLPSYVNQENYKKIIENEFLALGIFEDLEGSMQRIADILDKPFKKRLLPKRNRGRYSFHLDKKIKENFKKKNILSYAIYEYACEKFYGND